MCWDGTFGAACGRDVANGEDETYDEGRKEFKRLAGTPMLAEVMGSKMRMRSPETEGLGRCGRVIVVVAWRGAMHARTQGVLGVFHGASILSSRQGAVEGRGCFTLRVGASDGLWWMRAIRTALYRGAPVLFLFTLFGDIHGASPWYSCCKDSQARFRSLACLDSGAIRSRIRARAATP